MNLSVYGLGAPRRKAWLAVDLGVAFADDDLPGIEVIMPDVRFLVEERRNLVGITTASDIVNFTPSMSLNGENLSLRGVNRVITPSFGPPPGIAVFVDGIYTDSPDYLNQPDFFSDRIEIDRDPSIVTDRQPPASSPTLAHGQIGNKSANAGAEHRRWKHQRLEADHQ